ncbi:MAG: hypothetical protein ACI8UO_001016 [Verrucomicrobiales bacterium]|jgi:hypothetical protein
MLALLLCGLLLSSCSYWNRMGMSSKVAILSVASAGGMVGGPASLGGVASGLIAGGVASAQIVSTNKATTAQKTTALRVARMADSRMDPSTRKKLLASDKAYIAVRTSRNSSSNAGRASVMVYDMKKDTLVTDVLEVKTEPKEGDFVKFDNFFTQYVGDGVAPAPAPVQDKDEDDGDAETVPGNE